MKKTIKILLIVVIVLLMMNSCSYARWNPVKGFYGDSSTYMDTDIELGKSGAESSSKEITERILGVIQTIGSIISVVALLIIGFRYMFSSIEEKASMKGVLIYYVIGAVLVFATSNLLSIVYNTISKLTI